MHPPLFKPHPLCQDAIKALVSCHENNKILKFVGVCNTPKAELDACFRVRFVAFRRDVRGMQGPTPCPPAA